MEKKTIEQHEKELHRGTPITWEGVGLFFGTFIILAIIGFFGWIVFGFILGAPPTAEPQKVHIYDCDIMYATSTYP